MKKPGRAVAVLLLLFVTALPAAAACCVEKPMRSAAAMHAAMLCCGDTCQITKTATSRDHEIALTSNPTPAGPVAVVLIVTAHAPAASVDAAHDRISIDLSPPPPFLLHRQFRI